VSAPPATSREYPERVALRFVLNGRPVDAWAAPHETLLAVLRDTLGATEVKYGCGEGVCGTCTVLLDGAPINACVTLGVHAQGRTVTTVRGLAAADGMHPLQRAFVAHEAAQCGFCTPGMLLTAYAFLEEHPRPTRAEIRAALAGNLCRCTGYARIVDAVEACVRARPGGDRT
jgi:carbon-monoxide dehydrogenase small subunit